MMMINICYRSNNIIQYLKKEDYIVLFYCKWKIILQLYTVLKL